MNDETFKDLQTVYPFTNSSGRCDDVVLHESLAMVSWTQEVLEQLKSWDPRAAAQLAEIRDKNTIGTMKMLNKVFENYRRQSLKLVGNELLKELHPDDPYRSAVTNTIEKLYDEVEGQ